MPAVIDLTGQRFGRLTVMHRAPVNRRQHATWTCICDCGATKDVCGNDLRTHHVRSCGCLRESSIDHGYSYYLHRGCRCDVCRGAAAEYGRRYREQRRSDVRTGRRLVTHGTRTAYNDDRCRCDACRQAAATRTPRARTRISWRAMRERCSNPASINYPKYGARGITVCERWQSFDNFLADMGERPEGMTLDRIDGTGNYEPGNCRWATAHEQAANRRPRRKRKNQPAATTTG